MSLPVSAWPEAARTLWRTFGARGVRLRAAHELRRRLGRFRAAPQHAPAASEPLAWLAPDAARLAAATDRTAALARADRVLGGRHHAYRSEWRPLPEGDGWNRHPETGRRSDPTVPWWRVAHLDRAFGDIKDAWEPARFAWLYDLVRAHALTPERGARYADAAMARIRDWSAACPPFRGLQWSCGQETAIRAVALLHAEAQMGADWSEADRAHVRELLGASGERVADAIGYAVSQRNNHAVSEALGLVLLGLRFGGAHPEAAGWLRRGHALLARLVREQVAPDGWYVQHSLTYARLAAEWIALGERALRTRGLTLGEAAAARMRAAADLFAALAHAETGDVPNYGANDGAFVLPTTLAGYRDFRPVLTALCATWAHPLPADLRADAETLAWARLDAPPAGPPRADGVLSGASGWAVARVGETLAFFRAGAYTARPGHIDPLQLSVRFGRETAVADPGTVAYNGPGVWRNPLTGADVHNGPLVDGREPGVRGPRFLWYAWPEARLLVAEHVEGGDSGEAHVRLVGERAGEVQRSVGVWAGRVEVRDAALDGGEELSVVWTLPRGVAAERVAVEDAGGRVRVRVEPAREGAPAGWVSLHYGSRIPGQTVRATTSAAGPRGIVTTIHSRAPGADSSGS